MLVIRIEANDGLGIFMNYDNNCVIRDIISLIKENEENNLKLKTIRIRHNDFPTPYEEKLYITNEYFCAYNSIELLNEWIKPKEIKFLIEVGFNILMLEVTNYQTGKFQTIFTKDSIVSSKNINSLFM